MARPTINISCLACGGPGLTTARDLRRGHGKFCSKKCAYTMVPKKPEIERFSKYINKTNHCWLWAGSIGTGGYGWFMDTEIKKPVQAHRRSFELFVGNIPKNKFILHSCDVRKCVNPNHLFIGTASDNMEDMWAKGRHSIPRKYFTQEELLLARRRTYKKYYYKHKDEIALRRASKHCVWGIQ